MQDLIIQLLAGAVGGNLAGFLMKEKGLGVLGNTLAGLVGGAGLGQLLGGLGVLGEGTGGIVTNIAGSGVGGAAVMAIVGFIKQAMAKTQA